MPKKPKRPGLDPDTGELLFSLTLLQDDLTKLEAEKGWITEVIHGMEVKVHHLRRRRMNREARERGRLMAEKLREMLTRAEEIAGGGRR